MKLIRYKHPKVRILRRFFTIHKKWKYRHTHASQLPPATVEVLAVHLTGRTVEEIQKMHQELLRCLARAGRGRLLVSASATFCGPAHFNILTWPSRAPANNALECQHAAFAPD